MSPLPYAHRERGAAPPPVLRVREQRREPLCGLAHLIELKRAARLAVRPVLPSFRELDCQSRYRVGPNSFRHLRTHIRCREPLPNEAQLDLKAVEGNPRKN